MLTGDDMASRGSRCWCGRNVRFFWRALMSRQIADVVADGPDDTWFTCGVFWLDDLLWVRWLSPVWIDMVSWIHWAIQFESVGFDPCGRNGATSIRGLTLSSLLGLARANVLGFYQTRMPVFGPNPIGSVGSTCSVHVSQWCHTPARANQK